MSEIKEFGIRILKHISYSLWASFLVVGIPLLLYIFIKWDPVSRGGGTLGMWGAIVFYWAMCVMYIKKKDKLRKRVYDLGVLLGNEFSEEQKKKIRDEYSAWEFAEYKKLMKESPELASAVEQKNMKVARDTST